MNPFGSAPHEASLWARGIFWTVLLYSGLLLPTSPVKGETPSPKSDRPHITLAWHDPYRLLPRSYELIAREVILILSEMGTPLRIVRGELLDEPNEPNPKDFMVNVILHKATASQWGLDERAMGAAVGNYAYVFFPNVALALSLDPYSNFVHEPRATAQVARAIGRVVAHEVVHIVAPSLPHTAEGVMSASLTKRSLTRQHLNLGPETAAFVLDELCDWKRQNSPGVISAQNVIASDLGRKK